MSLTARHFDLPALPTQGAVEDTAVVDAIQASDASQGAGSLMDLRSSTEAHQRQRIADCLARHHDNWASAARELGLHRANLVRLAKRLGLPGKAAGS